MKRVFGLVCAALLAVAVTGITTASADEVSAAAPPTSVPTVTWNGNGTTNGQCSQIFSDPSVEGQEWLFILTSPSGSGWSITGEFKNSGPFGPIAGTQQGGGSIHFLVPSDIDDTLVSAVATNGSTVSVLTVSHCTVGGETPPPPEDTGSLSVVKITNPSPLSADLKSQLPGTFTAAVSCDDGTKATVSLPLDGGAGNPALISGIKDDAKCTVVETTDLSKLVGFTVVTTYSDNANVSPGVRVDAGENTEVDITNTFAQVSGEVVVTPDTPTEPVVEAATAVAASPAFTG
jgi:hypothetical protein